MAEQKKRTSDGVFDALKQISKDENVDFGLDNYTPDSFRKKYFTGPGNIENLYHALNDISDESGLDFGQGSVDEWLASFGYKKNPDTKSQSRYLTISGTPVGTKQPSKRSGMIADTVAVPQQQTAPKGTVNAEDGYIFTEAGLDSVMNGATPVYVPGKQAQQKFTQPIDLSRPEEERIPEEILHPFKQGAEEAKQIASSPDLNKYWAARQQEAMRRVMNPEPGGFGFEQRMAGLQQAEEAENARKINRSEFDKQNFGAFYDQHVKDILGEERQAGEQRSQEANKNVPSYDVPGAQSGFARMFERSVNYERETDPEKIANNTLQRVQDDEAFGDYVLQRMGISGQTADGEQRDSPQLSEREKEWMKRLFAKETGEVANQVIQRIYDTYKQEGAPESVLGYIAGKAFHENFAASLYDAMVRRAANSSGIREQLRAMASEEYGDNQSWLTRMAGGAAPFAVDMLTGGFYVPSVVGQAVVKGGVGLATKQVAKQMTKRAAERGLSGAALEEAASGAAGVAERYLATQAPIMNLAIRTAGSAANFATYEAQSEMVRQIAEGKFKPVDLLKEAVHGATLGTLMGATGGLISRATINSGLAGKVAGEIAGIGAETGIFAASSGITKAMEEGIDITDVDWADTTGEALGMVVGMKGVGAAMHPREFLKRYRKSKDYGLQLNQQDIDELKQAGYDFDGIFKGLVKFGEVTPESATVRESSKEFTVGPEGTGTKKANETESAYVDADAFNKILSNPEISSSVKRKLTYIATGKVLSLEPVFGADMSVDENGKATIVTRNAYGNIIESKEYKNAEKAQKEYELLEEAARTNTIGGLERIADQAGFPDVKDEAKGRTQNETGVDVDNMEKLSELPTEEANKVLDTYIKNLQEAYMQRFNGKMEQIGEAAAGGGTGGGVQGGAGTGGETPDTTERSERRQAAYDRGASVANDDSQLPGMEYDRKLAILRMLQQFPDGERAGVIRRNILDAVSHGDMEGAERLLDSYRQELSGEQVEAMEQYLDAQYTRQGRDEAFNQQVADYEQQTAAEVSAKSDEHGNVTELTLKDGSTVYLVKGDPNLPMQQLIVTTEDGQQKDISSREVAQVVGTMSADDMIAQMTTQYADQLRQQYDGIANGMILREGQEIDFAMGGQLAHAVVMGQDVQGNYVVQLEDGSRLAMRPDHAAAAIEDADNIKIKQALEGERNAVAEQQRTERFNQGIVGYQEGTPDLTAKDTKPEAAAEYMLSQVDADGQPVDRKQVLQGLQTNVDQLVSGQQDVQRQLQQAYNNLTMSEDGSEEQRQAQAVIDQLSPQLKDMEAQQRKWGEIRQAMMNDEERQAFEKDRIKAINTAKTQSKKDVQPEGNTAGEAALIPSGKELLEQYEDRSDAENFVSEQRKQLSRIYRDNVYPKWDAIQKQLDDYQHGLTELTPEQVKTLTDTQTLLEAGMTQLVEAQNVWKKLEGSLGRLYASRERQNMTPHDLALSDIAKESNSDKKLKLAKVAYKDDEAALSVLDNVEPQDVYEHIAANLGAGSINWEGIQRGEHYVRGLRDEFGKDKTRGIGADYDTNGYNKFLAPEGQGKGIDEVVHDLSEGSPYDTEEVRNALLDMLSSAKKPSDISNRIVDDRIAQAEQIYNENLERERQAQIEFEDDAIRQTTGLEPDEYDAMIADLEQRLAEQEGFENSDDYFKYVEEYEQRENERRAGGGQAQGAVVEPGQEGEQAGSPQEVTRGADAADGGTVETKSSIQGLESYSEEEIKQLVRDYAQEWIDEVDSPAEIVDIAIIGSRANGMAQEDSDLDVLLEFKGDETEDGLFNLLNHYSDEPLFIEGIKVDINPITKGKSGTIAEFLERNKDYKKEDLAAKPQETTEQDGSFAARLAKAKEETNVNPTEAQKEAGNYKKPQVKFGGYTFRIENPKGSIRSGVDKNGNPWSIEMQDTYGYIEEKTGKDGDKMDFFINDDADLDEWNGRVFIVDQMKEDGTFDEHKVMYGYPTWSAARKAYERNYKPGWWDKHVMKMTGTRKVNFDKWMADSDHKTKPFYEYYRTKMLKDTVSDPVDQLLADIKDRENLKPDADATGVVAEPSFKAGELESRNIDELKQLKKKAQQDKSTSKVLLGTTNVAPGSLKERTLKENIAKAEADIASIDKVLEQKQAEQAVRIEQQEIGGAMVDRLEDMGFSVSTDNKENRRIHKLAEQDKSESGRLRHFETPDGKVYGFTYKGDIYLDPTKIDAELPIHEYAHPWCEAFRKLNPQGWQDIVGLMKGDKDTWDFIKQLYPNLKDESDIAEAMIAKFSGKKGAERAKAEFERMNSRDPEYKSKWSNIWKNISKAIQDFWKQVGDFLHIKYKSVDQVYDQVVRDFANKINPRKKVEEWLKERDDTYLQAVEMGDMDNAKELFDEALRENIGNGITPFVSAGGYRGKMQKLAHGIKTRDPKVIAEVADLMTPLIPKDAVLVPAPSHTGEATDMLDLAQAISERTGAPVANVLKSAERGSQYEAKNAGKPLSASELGIFKDGELPEGLLPVVIDNVVDTGNTAEACVKALGKGIVASLAGSKGRYKRVTSLKSAEPIVTDKNGNVVPLSDRFEFMIGEGSLFTDKDFEEPATEVAITERSTTPQLNEYGLNESTPIGRKMTRFEEENNSSNVIPGYIDSKTGEYVFLGNTVDAIEQFANDKQLSNSGEMDGMKYVRLSERDFDALSPKMVKAGWKLAFTTDDTDEPTGGVSKSETPDADATGTVAEAEQVPVTDAESLMNEVQRRKENAIVKKEADDTIKKYLEEKPKDDQDTQVRKRATKAVLKAMDNAGVPYKVVSKQEERQMMKLFSMMNQEAVKEFARRPGIRAYDPVHGSGEYIVYNMQDPFGIPMYFDKLDTARYGLKQMKNIAPMGDWAMLRIGLPGQEKQADGLKDAADMQAMMGWHGSGARFDAFDHRYMSSGEGNQSYGWGTYITEVEGIGKMYAEAMGSRHTPATYKGITSTSIALMSEEEYKKLGAANAQQREILAQIVGSCNFGYGDPVRMINVKRERLEEQLERKQAVVEDAKEQLEEGNLSEERLTRLNNRIRINEKIVKETQESLDFVNSLDPNDFKGWSKPNGSFLYKVDIPEDTGDNYFDWTKPLPEERADKILAEVRKRLLTDDKYGWKGKEEKLDKQLEAMKKFFGETFYWRVATLLGNSVAGAHRDGHRMTSELLSKHGYVGVKYPAEYRSGGRDDGAMNYVIFNEDDAKIKEVIQFMVGGDAEELPQRTEQPVFYSNAMRAVEGIKQEKATPEQWLKMIEKAGGLKAGEDKWIGLSDWLKEQQANGKKSLTKQEVEDYIRQNQIKVEEVDYSENAEGTYRKLDDLNKEYTELCNEYFYKYDDPVEIAEHAFNDMVSKYGEDFQDAFEIEYDRSRAASLIPSTDMYGEPSDLAQKYLGEEGTEKPINSTRLRYTTDGLENKKEIALTVPTIEPYNESDSVHFGDAGGGRAVAWVRFGDTTTGARGQGAARTILDDIEKRIGTTTDYSKMSDEDAARRAFANYLWRANPDVDWMRTSEIPGDIGAERAENVVALFDKLIADNANGKRVLVIDEIQSKRHQDAREKGYREDLVPGTELYNEYHKLKDNLAKKDDEYDEYLEGLRKKYGQTDLAHITTAEERQTSRDMFRELEDARLDLNHFERTHHLGNFGTESVPVAPFEKNWHELAMKRMLRYAAENGYDKIAWTTGEQQADRYDIGDKIKDISVSVATDPMTGKPLEGKYDIFPHNHNNSTIMVDGAAGLMDKDQILRVYGKDLGQRMIGAADKAGVDGDVLSGDDLRIGAEGMRGFYDEMLVRFMNKYSKKWGVKVEQTELPEIGQTMWTIDVTPEMKESVMQGQPMFHKQDKKILGWSDGKQVFLTQAGLNPNTPLHECTHLWDKWCQKEHPELWAKVVNALKKTEMWKQIAENPNYRNIWNNENRMASEVHSRLSGATGEEEFMKAAFKKSTPKSIINEVKSALRKFWEAVLRLFNKHAKTLADDFESLASIVRMPIRDLVNEDFEKVMRAAEGRAEGQLDGQQGNIFEKSLVGLHNLSIDQLKRALKKGGLANPSVAVIDALKQTHDKYGDVTLVLPNSMVAAKTGRHKGVFGGDIYSPNYPEVHTRLSDKNQKALSKWIYDNAGENGQKLNMFQDFMQSIERSRLGGLEYLFLKEKGVDMSQIDDYVREGVDNFWVDYIKKYDNPASFYQDWLKDEKMRSDITKNIVAKETDEFKRPIMRDIINQRRAEGQSDEQIKKEMMKIRFEAYKKAKKEIEESLLDNNGDIDFNIAETEFSKNYRLYQNHGAFDPSETKWNVGKYIRDNNLYEEYDKWAQELLDKYEPNEVLWNGTDDMGRPKYIANTLENASRIMKKQGLQGGDSFFAASMGGARAQLTPVFKTLADIRKNKWRLGEEAFEKAKEELESEYYELADLFENSSSYYDGKYYDLIDAMKSGDAYNWAKKHGFDISKEDGARIDDFADALRNMPTGYFELKFERPVGIDEFAVAVVPNTTPFDVIDQLEKAGLDVRTYDSTGTEDEHNKNRRSVLMDAVGMRDDIMFQFAGKYGAEQADKAEGTTMRQDNLKVAEEMEKAGKDTRAIKLATGWERGKDGQWRYETVDADVDVLKPYEDKLKTFKGVRENPVIAFTLDELIGEKNELFKYYPEMKNVTVLFDPNMEVNIAGSADGNNIALNSKLVNRFDNHELDNESMYGTLLHEVQHIIQSKEGFAQGGSLSTATTEAGMEAIMHKKEMQRSRVIREIDMYNKWLSSEKELEIVAQLDGRSVEEERKSLTDYLDTLAHRYDNLTAQIDRIYKLKTVSMTDARNLYESLAGEVEARNVTERMGMSEQERRNTPAEKSEDIARENQVVIMDEGERNGITLHIEDDAETLKRLDKEPKEVGYRNVVLNEDGTMGSPMADKLGKKGMPKVKTSPFEFQKWERSDENPQLATDNGKIDLGKPDGLGTVSGVDYNPYIHIRPTTVNKQFKNAWERPNLVYIETQYPKSELTSGYHAEKAKLPVGKHPWNGGELILSRWDKPTRIVPWEEVAPAWIEEFKDRGVEFDIVPQGLRPLLVEAGVEILPPHKGMGKDCKAAYEEWKAGQTSQSEQNMYRHVTPAENEANTAYNKQLDEYANGKMTSSEMFDLGEPSPVLRISGVTGNRIMMNQSVLRDHQKKHNLSFEDLRNLPSALYHPIMVYQWGDKAKSHIIVTELTTQDGRKVTVTIRVNNTGKVLDVEKITSVHGKDLEHIIREINTDKTDFVKDNLKYVNKEKALEWLAVDPPKGSRQVNQELISAAKLIKDSDLSKYYAEKIAELYPELTNAVEAAGKQLGGVKVVLEAVAPEEGTLGWYNPNDNSVHVVVPAHADANDAVRTVFHEKLGHEGLVALFGSQDEVNKFGQFIFRSASKDLRNKMIAKADEEGYSWTDPLRFSKAAQEVFGDIAADGPKTSDEFDLWTKVKHYIIKFCKALGIKVRGLLNDNDLRYYVLKTGEALKRWNKMDEGARQNLAQQTSAYDIMRNRGGKPRQRKGESMASFMQRLSEWEKWKVARQTARDNGDPEPTEVTFHEQAEADFKEDLKEWKERNGIGEGETFDTRYPTRRDGESPQEFAMRVAEYEEKNDVWKTAPSLMDYLRKASDDYRQAYTAWRERYDLEEQASIDQRLYEGDVEPTPTFTDADQEAQALAERDLAEAAGFEVDEAGAKRHAKLAVIDRRKNLQSANAEDAIWVYDFMKQTDAVAETLSQQREQKVTGKQIREALPFLIEADMRRDNMQAEREDAVMAVNMSDAIQKAHSFISLDNLESIGNELKDLEYAWQDKENNPNALSDAAYRDAAARLAEKLNELNGDMAGYNPLFADDIMQVRSLLTHASVAGGGEVMPASAKEFENAPEVQQLMEHIKDWYDNFYQLLEDAGLRGDAGYFDEYVNHVWDKEKSDAKAWEKYIENRQRTKSPNMRHREIATYMDGISVGLVPKYTDIADMIAHYSRQNNEAVANSRFLDDLKFVVVEEMNDEGEVTAILPLIMMDKPDGLIRDKYAQYYVPGIGDVYVLKHIQKRFANIFGTMRTPDVPDWLSNVAKGYDLISSTAKKIQLALSGFHALALFEVDVAQNNPITALKHLGKYIIADSINYNTVPAYAHPEDFKLAAKHLVQLGATEDYAAADVNAITAKIREAFEGWSMEDAAWKKAAGTVGSPVAILMDWVNKGFDTVLWNYLHDGLKLCAFKELAKQIDRRAASEGLDEQTREKLLDEAGQYVNDMFGGQWFDIINVSPALLKWMRRAFLSPDWLLSTQRHFLANFGFGSVYSDSGFRNYIKYNSDNIQRLLGKDIPHDELRRLRSKNAKYCYMIGAIVWWGLFYNAINALCRWKDEKDEKDKADEIRKTNPNYKSPYELAYPDGMKWYDYTMYGNTIGQNTHLFTGRYSDGTETYVRWGKQFREFPELFIGRHGLEFPSPIIQRMMSKANPNVGTMIDFLGAQNIGGFNGSYENKELREKYGKTVATLAALQRHFIPFGMPTQADKEYKWLDFFMPSSKGFSRWKAKDYFETFILDGDWDGIEQTYNACVMNGIDAEANLNAAISSIKAAQKRELSDGVSDLSTATEKFDTATTPEERALYLNKIKKYLKENEYKVLTKEEAIEKVRDFIEGTDVKEKENKRYVMLATSEDVIAEEKLKDLGRKAKKFKKELEARKASDDYETLKNQYGSWLKIDKIVGKAVRSINKSKKQLGALHEDSIMTSIRETISQAQQDINELEAPK